MKATHYNYNNASIVHLEFPTHLSMVLGIARAQEFAEHVHFKGQFLSMPTFFDKVVGAQKSDDYITEFYGINIPGAMYLRWVNGILALTKQETQVYDLIQPMNKFTYIIGSIENDIRTANHEFAHAFWGLNASYRADMLNLLLNLKPKIMRKSAKYLKSMLYSPESYNDERQAFFATSPDREIYELFGVKPNFLATFQERFDDEQHKIVKVFKP